jgi:hypothetical protein
MFLLPRRTGHGQLYGFEVDGDYVSLRQLYECIVKMHGVRVSRKSLPFLVNATDMGDYFVEFELEGELFVIETEFSDYWIGPKNSNEPCPQIVKIYEHIDKHALPSWKRELLDLIYGVRKGNGVAFPHSTNNKAEK